MKNLKKLFPVSILILSLLAGVVLLFTTCDSPMGLGKPIDFEPPTLSMADLPTPYYVNLGTVLYGTVKDNIDVKEIQFRELIPKLDGSGNIQKDNGGNIIYERKTMKTATLTNKRSIKDNGYPKLEYDWVIDLDFYTEDDNGKTIFSEVVAFDNMGNSGEDSIKSITLFIDIRPPLTEDVWIQRTSVKRAELERHGDLKGLELMDPHGTVNANANKYQNGFFHINATLSENETRITELYLNIYDPQIDINTPLLRLERLAGTSEFAPRWLISEEQLLAAGELLQAGYINNYYTKKCHCHDTSPAHTNSSDCANWVTPRYYYRVATEAKDLGNNDGEALILEDEGYFVMWETADEPKGILDPVIGTVLTRGSTLPVEFYDDDRLGWAFTGLLTKDQWEGIKPIASGVNMMNHNPGSPATPINATDEEKLAWLKNRLVDANNTPTTNIVYNWKYDKKSELEAITNQINADNMDERTVMLQTGQTDSDYGEFKLFTLTSDVKIAPHTNAGPRNTDRPRWAGRAWKIDIIDENAPLIVFDVNGGSPEENTFPSLSSNEYFTIKGYTLRENGSSNALGFNGVVRFRMAWIPVRMQGGADSYITRVENALKGIGADGTTNVGYPASFTGNPELDGIQYWDFGFSTGSSPSYTYNKLAPVNSSDPSNIVVSGGNWINAGAAFRRQNFQRTFSVLGSSATQDANFGPGASGSGWKDFHSIDSNGQYTLENDTKLLIFYAECNMGHQVFRNIRYLGNTTPPNIDVYNITGKIDGSPDGIGAVGSNTGTGGIPNVSIAPYNGDVNNPSANPTYETALRTYNQKTNVLSVLRAAGTNVTVDDLTQPFQAFPRGSILKFFVEAQPTTGIGIKNIQIDDVTFENAIKNNVGGGYFSTDQTNTYIEYYPDEAQRVLRFTAEDLLGNRNSIQRTIAVTNTALLESITTTTQDGTYGHGQEIILKANFTGLVSITAGTGGIRPELNIRFPLVNPETGVFVRDEIRSIQCEAVSGSTLSLEFKLNIPETIDGLVPKGKIETMFEGISGTQGTAASATDRPIRLMGTPSQTIINDTTRTQPAFVPGYNLGTSNMPNWTTDRGSLQAGIPPNITGKNINLDFTRPVINTVTVGGKNRYSGNANNEYYFRLDETIEVTLSSDAGKNVINTGKLLRPSDTGTDLRLQYQIRDSGGTVHPTATTYYNAAFTYQRPSGSNGLVFALTTDGTVVGTTENDTTGGAVTAGSGTRTPYDGEIINLSMYTTGARRIVDQFGNEVTSASVQNLSSLMPANTHIYIKRSRPPLPDARLFNTQFQNLTDVQKNTNQVPTLTVNATSTTGTTAQWEDIRRYSIDGGNNWTLFTTDFNTFPQGTYNIHARYEDRAGNIGNARTTTIVINNTFPRLLGVTAVSSSGTYKPAATGTQPTLSFALDFAAPVRFRTNFANTDSISLTLRDTTNTTNNPDGETNSYEKRLSGAAADTNSTVTAAAAGSATGSTTVTFTWTNLTGKDMLNGLRVYQLNLSGLEDIYTNTGPATAAITVTQNTTPTLGGTVTYNTNTPANYNMSGIIVSGIRPRADTWTPVNAQGRSGNITTSVSANNRVITITFTKPVQKGNGTITVRPHGDYAIPAVFENAGYYVQIDTNGNIVNDTEGFEVRSSTRASNNHTWVAGFSDIYNSTGVTNTMKNYLTESATAASAPVSTTLDTTNPSMSRLRVSPWTGLSVGPYVMTTHGLTRGAGYTGSYGNATTPTDALPGIDAPGPRGTNFMVPDITAKWVLRYNIADTFGVNNTADATGSINLQTAAAKNTAVTNIRAALTAAKFRWQEIPVTHSNVTIANTVVTINLIEPLLPGLQWTVDFGEGTFTDLAGNQALGQTSGAYWFLSAGAQRPTVRVDRKSYDARRPSDNDLSGVRVAGDYNTAGYGTGWGFADFDTINYRINTETPNARIFYNTQNGRAFTVTPTSGSIAAENRIGSATGAWTGRVTTNAFTNVTNTDTIIWGNDTGPIGASGVVTTGTWVRPNMIFRNRYQNQVTNNYYNKRVRDGFNVQTNVRGMDGANGGVGGATNSGYFYGFRSYNKDATITELNNLARTAGGTADEVQTLSNYFSYDRFEASKNYVVAEARINHGSTTWGNTTTVATSPRGYEGVFRTVVMLNQSGLNGTTGETNRASDTSPLTMFGTTAANSIPVIPAFPMKDGVHEIDARFGKFYYRIPDGFGNIASGRGNRFFWVSSEMVNQWVIQNWGKGSSDGANTYTRMGDDSDWISSGYGDLTYAHNIMSW